MLAHEFIKEAQSVGWRVLSSRNGMLSLGCKCIGCPGRLSVPLTALNGPVAPCPRKHHGQYAAPVYQNYRELVGALVAKRRSLGLSQEDVTAAAGLADGHINKLEAFSRTAQLPTLQLWAETVGLSLTLTPATLPRATVTAIEQRPAPLREYDTQPKSRQIQQRQVEDAG